ncbi:hypothetical protein ACOSQ4_013981 [Xanthoceras sorbifolium]
MIPDVFKNGGPLSVKGHEVHISVEAINEYYELENVNHTGEHTDNPTLTLYNEDLVRDFHMSGKGTWLSSRAVMKSEELPLDSTFWYEFCLYYLFPKSTRGMVSPDVAYVLYSIRHNLPINIGFLIRQQITAIEIQGGKTMEMKCYLMRKDRGCVLVNYIVGPIKKKWSSIICFSPLVGVGWGRVGLYSSVSGGLNYQLIF